jgi:hypothetical protein
MKDDFSCTFVPEGKDPVKKNKDFFLKREWFEEAKSLL